MTWTHHPQSHIKLRSGCQVKSPDKFKTLLQETYGATKPDMLVAFDSFNKKEPAKNSNDSLIKVPPDNLIISGNL